MCGLTVFGFFLHAVREYSDLVLLDSINKSEGKAKALVYIFLF